MPEPTVQRVVPVRIGQLIAELPKVELHVHLEGSASPATLQALARKHGLPGVPEDPVALARWYEFRDFEHFVEVYLQTVQGLRDEQDFALLTGQVGRDLAAANVRYAEVHVSLHAHLDRGVPAEVVFAGVEAGRREVEHVLGVRLAWIPDFTGHLGAPAGEETLDAILAHGPPSVIGFGVGGIEVQREQFAAVFARARGAGLHSIPHAGETAGPDRMWQAIRALGAERIGHGIATVHDPQLLDYLREHEIGIDVCPTSNVRTRAVETLASHPLPALLAAGVLVSLNSDDPPMFGTSLSQEYAAAYSMGIDAAGLVGLAAGGVRASFLPPAAKSRLLAEIKTVESRYPGASPDGCGNDRATGGVGSEEPGDPHTR